MQKDQDAHCKQADSTILKVLLWIIARSRDQTKPNQSNTQSIFGLVFTQILLRYLSQKMTGKASDEETQKLFDIEGGDPGFVA